MSFGGFDAIGHNFGPDSLERVAAVTELDRQIGDLLDVLTELVGPRLLVALTSDHGVAPVVDIARQRGHVSARVMLETLVAPVEAALTEKFGPGEYVEVLAFLFLKLEVQPNKSRDALLKTAVEALVGLPVVHRAFVVDRLRSDGDALEQLFYRSAAPGRSGDIAIALEPYHAPYVKWRGYKGAEHGSPWEYDRHVPLILWGDGVVAGRVTKEVAVIDLTRTLGDRLGLTPLRRGGQPLP